MRDNAAIVRQFIDETLNQGDIAGAGRFVWEDVVEQVLFPGQGPGLTGLQDVLRAMRAAFPDLHWSVEEQMTDGEKGTSMILGRGAAKISNVPFS